MANLQLNKKESIDPVLLLKELCKKLSIDYYQFANIWAEKYVWQRRLWNYSDQLGFNQRVCRDVTNMILSEPVRIWTPSDNVNALIDKEIKGRLHFDSVFSKNLAHCMGIGDMLMSVYVDPADQKPAINYIPGHNIIPISYSNHDVSEVAWFTVQKVEEDTFVICTIEKMTGRETMLFKYDSMSLLTINYGTPMWTRILGDIQPEFNYNEETPVRKFAWISTGLNNARWIDTPFHNSFIWPIKYIDTLKRDWELFEKEYKNSVKRIFLSPELVKRTYDVTDSNGNPIPMKKADMSDSLFECVDMSEEQVKEWAPQVRFDVYAQKIKFDLQCWGMAVGLGAEMYDFDKNGQIQGTATQVVLSHREAFNTINNIKYNLEYALRTIVWALIWDWYNLGYIADEDMALIGDQDGVAVHFDDGVFVNYAAKVQEGLNLYMTKGADGSSAIDKFTFLTRYCNFTEKEALTISQRSQAELMNAMMLQMQLAGGQQGGEDKGNSSEDKGK